ncbi:cation:proton antiporter [Leptolyngbya sp. Heron Island J]|uniref:cation:proton antiporter n=1 Tax=Leptolyngbya sp. Heron Island J TaxID=1385935 RepID=UPI0003B968F2|nr:cation:proton antiporter [Leptolyngbya sp. Heron Island J]ESA37524.1 cation:proton antiporter [Leptolyngbya sp. Heron Island J]
MMMMTIAWIALPLFVGFSIYLLPKLDRYLAMGVVLVSVAYSLTLIQLSGTLDLQLLDNFGVRLLADSLSGYFILGNALVTTAVLLYCWPQEKSAFFFTQLTVLHGSVNAVFICADFISLYVALEVVGIAAFLLIAYPRTDRSIWIGLRYLFVSNTAMLFYLIGAVLVYQASGSFSYVGLQQAPTDAIALIMLGMLTKGGIFVSGLWLPLTHSESETPVSAMLSGVVVKTGVFPLVRCALLVSDIQPILQIFSVATALLGVGYAIFEKDTKRMLAASTISQLGFVIAAPALAGFYALSHGLAKAALFLVAGNLPSRSFQELRQTPIQLPVWGVLVVASLSISGFPLVSGFNAKALTLKALDPWQSIVLTIAATGTAIAFAKFIFLPFQRFPESVKQPSAGFWPALALLIGGLITSNSFSFEAYTLSNINKALLVIAAGWFIYSVWLRKLKLELPRAAERLEHLIGAMSLILVLLFSMVLA